MTQSQAPPTLPTVTVQVTCDKKADQSPFFRASEPSLGGRPGAEDYRAFWIEWSVKQGCKATLVSAQAMAGGSLRGFATSSNGKKATALGILDDQAKALVYNLCAQRAAGTEGELVFGVGELTTDTLMCQEAMVTTPHPPPKVIGPGSFAPDRERAPDSERAPAAAPVHVRVSEMIWTDGKTPYLQASVPTRARGEGPETVRIFIPKGYTVDAFKPEAGGTLCEGSGQPSGQQPYVVKVDFDAGNELTYELILKDKHGALHTVYGGRPCDSPQQKAAQAPPKPPPVIIGDP